MLDNVIMILAMLILLSIIGIGVCQFLKLSKEKQKQLIIEWLLLAVVKAEKELGGGTGQLKLRYVYDLFLDKFKFISLMISFDQFSNLVDQALDVMKAMINDNKKVKEYIEK